MTIVEDPNGNMEVWKCEECGQHHRTEQLADECAYLDLHETGIEYATDDDEGPEYEEYFNDDGSSIRYNYPQLRHGNARATNSNPDYWSLELNDPDAEQWEPIQLTGLYSCGCGNTFDDALDATKCEYAHYLEGLAEVN